MKEGYSKVRNHVIASAFAYMNIIEQWGSGIPRIIREVAAYGLQEPEFVDMECALRINIYRNKVGHNETNFDTNDILKDAEKQLLKLIELEPEKLQKEYAATLEVSISTIKRLFAQLQIKGIVQREGSSRKGKWIIVKK